MLQIDGRGIGDSTEIIAELEARFPEPPLYPADAEQRRRALELEDFFDEELGPHMRLLAFHELGRDPERFSRDRPQPPPAISLAPAPSPMLAPTRSLRSGASSEEKASSPAPR